MKHLHALTGIVSELRFGEKSAQGNVLARGVKTALGGPFFNPVDGAVQILREGQWVNAQVVSSLFAR